MAAALVQPPVAVALASIQPLPAALVLTGLRPPVNTALMHYIGLHKYYAKLPTERYIKTDSAAFTSRFNSDSVRFVVCWIRLTLVTNPKPEAVCLHFELYATTNVPPVKYISSFARDRARLTLKTYQPLLHTSAAA